MGLSWEMAKTTSTARWTWSTAAWLVGRPGLGHRRGTVPPPSPGCWAAGERWAAVGAYGAGMTRCLVTGSSGYIGSRLVSALHRAGHIPVATARDTTKLDCFDWPRDVQRLELDVADVASCRTALASARVEVAYFLVHSLGEGDFATHDLDSARTFARAARKAGVRRLVYLGGFVPADDHLSEHLESRADVGDALGEDGVELVWLRAAIILGAGSTSYELIRHLADRVPVIPLPTWMNHPVSPVAVDDVLHYLVAAAGSTVPAGAYDLTNGESPTYSELIKTYARVNGRRRVWLPLPPIPPAVVARVAALLTPLPHALTADLIMSLPNTMRSHDHHIRALVPDPPGGLTRTDEAFRRARSGAEPDGVHATADPLHRTRTDPDWSA